MNKKVCPTKRFDPTHGGGMLPVERPVLVKEYGSSERAHGQVVRGEFGDLQKQDAIGRLGVLVGFKVVLGLNVDTTSGASLPYPGEDLFGIIDDVELQDAFGHVYLPGRFDARRLRDDMAIREGYIRSTPSDLPDATDDGVTTTLELNYRFGPSAAYERAADGGIPLVALDHRMDANAILKFKIASALPGSPAGVDTYNTPDKLELYAIVRYVPFVDMDAAWVLDEDTFPAKQGTIEPPEWGRDSRLEYAAIRHLTEDTGGVGLSDYDSISAKMGSDTWLSAIDRSQLVDLQEEMYDEHPRADGIPSHLDSSTPSILFLSPYRPYAPRDEMGRAPLHWDVKTRSSHTVNTRVLHRQWVQRRPEWREQVLCASGINPKDAVRVPQQRAMPGTNPDLVVQKVLPSGHEAQLGKHLDFSRFTALI